MLALGVPSLFEGFRYDRLLSTLKRSMLILIFSYCLPMSKLSEVGGGGNHEKRGGRRGEELDAQRVALEQRWNERGEDAQRVAWD